MPQPRYTLRRMMIVVAALAVVIGLLRRLYVYRMSIPTSFDESGGTFDGWVMVLTDLLLPIGVPILATLALLWFALDRLLRWLRGPEVDDPGARFKPQLPEPETLRWFD